MNFERLKLGVFQSGQMGQTVNLLSLDFGGSNPSAPTYLAVLLYCALRKGCAECGNSSVDRALAFQAGGRGFESRFPLTNLITLYHRDAEVGSTEIFSVGWGEN